MPSEAEVTDIILKAGAVLNLNCGGLTAADIQAALLTALAPTSERQITMSQAIDDLVREVQESRTVQGSAIALLQGLKAQLDEAVNSGDMDKVRQAVADLDAGQQELAAAITANTPAAPTA
jgi:hypothetical protein